MSDGDNNTSASNGAGESDRFVPQAPEPLLPSESPEPVVPPRPDDGIVPAHIGSSPLEPAPLPPSTDTPTTPPPLLPPTDLAPSAGAESGTLAAVAASGPVYLAPATGLQDVRPAIRVRGLTKHYGKLAAVDNIDLDVPTGAIFGLIGPNGAGKSTTFSVIASLLKPTSGAVEVMGFDPIGEPREVRQVVGYMPDSLGVYGDLHVDDYLRFFAAAYRIPPKRWDGLVDGLLELVDLDVKRDTNVDALSRGMKQRISLARALVHDPDLLILDEPASGLDPRARVELRELLVQLSGMGKTIIISSHILSELEAVCTDVAIMEAGKVLAAGSPESIRGRLGGGTRVQVRFTDGTSEEFPVASEYEQAELLRRLVLDDQRVVLSFANVGGGLEDLFMQVTEGIVQ